MRFTISEKILLVGAGDHARVVLDILRETKRIKDVVGFVDAYDNPSLKDKAIEGIPIVGNASSLKELFERKKAKSAVVCLGKNRDRERLTEELVKIGYKLVSAIHPSATVSSTALIGEGTMVCAGSIIVTGVKIGRSVIVNTGATIDYDCEVGDFAHIAPGAHLAGRVKVGKGCFIGINSSVKQGLIVGDYAIVAAGAAVINDVANFLTVGGVPAKPLRHVQRDNSHFHRQHR